MSIKVSIPGSKSLTNRAIIIAALSDTKVIIKNPSPADDTRYLIKCLKQLGIKISLNKNNLTITGSKRKFKKSNKTIKLYTANAGTTTRFLTAFSTLIQNKIIIDGDKRMRERPIIKLTEALNKLGAEIKTTKSHLPIKISPKKLIGDEISLPGDISSQYLSAILLVAPFAQNKTTINIENTLCSKPYVEMTIEVLKKFGIKVINKSFKQFIIAPVKTTKAPKSYEIESDASSASYIGAYAASNPGKELLLKNINKNSLQGDIKFIKYLQKMGCKICFTENDTSIKGPIKLKSLGEIDMNETPDLVMTFSVLAMFTKGKTKITNIANLRIKETDRIKALENEIKKFGIKVTTGKNYIEIIGDPEKIAYLKNKPINIHTYNDHRIAMCFAILKDKLSKLKIENPECVSKSYPTFWKDLKKIQRT